MRVCDMIEEAATAACILQEPELADILHVPDMSLFSPPVPVPLVKPEPVEVIEVPDSPPPVRPPPTEAPIDYRRAYEELQRRMQGHMEQMHFWVLTVGELGQELTREPTAQERARRQRLITAGYWPPWMAEVVGAPFSVLGENFRIYYGALLHEGGASILNGSSQERGTPGYGRDLGQVPQPAPRLTHSFIILAFIFYRRTMVGLFVKRSQGYWRNYLPVPGQDSFLSCLSLFQFIL